MTMNVKVGMGEGSLREGDSGSTGRVVEDEGTSFAAEVAVVGRVLVARVNSVGVCNDAATVWPMLTLRRMITPS